MASRIWAHLIVALLGCILASCLRVCYSDSDSRRSPISPGDRKYLESLSLQGKLTFENTTASAKDWGQLRGVTAPAVVLHPTSVDDIATVVRSVARLESELTVAARGLGSSTGSQSQVSSNLRLP